MNNNCMTICSRLLVPMSKNRSRQPTNRRLGARWGSNVYIKISLGAPLLPNKCLTTFRTLVDSIDYLSSIFP